MQKILLLFATREGQTAKIAARISEHLRDAGVDVTLADAADRAATRAVDPRAFDRLVFGASMHAGGIERELVRYINGHHAAIVAKPHSFFLVLLSAATQDPGLRGKWLDDARRRLSDQLEVPFDDVEMIAGALMYSKYAWPLRWVMRRIAAKAGGDTDTRRDYEYTDWDQVRRYAERLTTKDGT